MLAIMSGSAMERSVKFRILPRVMDHIGLAMYSSVPKAISELVANSYDANASEVFVDFTQLESGLSEIVITDNGDGMTPETIENAYLTLGYNKRNTRASGGRRPIGNKGIGKLAGMGIATAMEVTSVKNGKKTSVLITRSHFQEKDADLGDIEFPMSVSETAKEPNGTRVRLFELP